MQPFDPRQNPYAAPQAPMPHEPQRVSGLALPGQFVPLYSPNQVALATFCGTVVAGSILMTLNERRVGRASAGWAILGGGIVISALIFGLAFVLPDNIPSAPISIAPIVAMRFWAQKRQGMFVNEHYMMGGKRGSGWVAFGIGMACLVAIVAIALLVGIVYALATGEV
jgi:hypothetical protein